MKAEKRYSYVYTALLFITCLTVGIFIIGVASEALAQSLTIDPPENPYTPPAHMFQPVDHNPFPPLEDLYQSQPVDATGEICAGYPGVVTKFAYCIQHTIVWAVGHYIAAFIGYFVSTINVMMTFAVLVYGFFVLTGRAQPAGREAVTLIIKIGFIVFLVNQLQFVALFSWLLDIINWLIGVLVIPAIDGSLMTFGNLLPAQCGFSMPNIWLQVDCVIERLIGGVLGESSIQNGMIGFALAMLLSEGMGIPIFFFIAGIIFQILMTVLHALFILLTAYMAMALLALMAPLMIPLVLFRATKGRFDKWARMLIGVMLQPIFLVAYLTLFLLAMEYALFTGNNSVYHAIACGHSEAADFSIGEYAYATGHIKERSGDSSIWSLVVSQDNKQFKGTPEGATKVNLGFQGEQPIKDVENLAGPPIEEEDENQPNPENDGDENPNDRDDNDVDDREEYGLLIDMPVEAVDMESMLDYCNETRSEADELTATEYITRIIMSLFTAVAIGYIFYTMLGQIPYLGTMISSDLFGLPNLSNLIPQSSIQGNEFFSKLGFGRRRGG